jgi:hypothetical protein
MSGCKKSVVYRSFFNNHAKSDPSNNRPRATDQDINWYFGFFGATVRPMKMTRLLGLCSMLLGVWPGVK